ncbi:MAG: glycosyltransferase family 4 protein, partial [Nitrososphaerales archaeon]
YLSKEQARLGNEVHVIARKKASQPSSESLDGVEIHRVKNPFSVNAFQMIRRLANGESSPPTIIHTHATNGLFLAPLKKTLKAHLVAQVHGTSHSHYMPKKVNSIGTEISYSPMKMSYYYFRERSLWSAADRVVTVANVIKNDLISFYGIRDDKIDVIYNGVDTSIFKPLHDFEPPKELEKLEGKKIVLFVGHFGLRKGLPFVIEAMKKVREIVPDAVLVCIGGVPSWLGDKDDYWSFLRSIIEKARLKDTVYLLDKVPNALLPMYYSMASVFVLPTYYEAFGKVIIEAMACGLPVITTRRGGNEEAVEDGVTGILVNYGSAPELAEALTGILKDEKLARSMGEKGRQRVEREFTWNIVAGRIGKAYETTVFDMQKVET